MRRTLELGSLLAVVPLGLVHEAIAKAGKQSKRVRKLPEIVVFWLVVGLGLHRDLSISNVLDRVAEALRVLRWGPAERPCKTSIAKARDRLGWQVVRTVFRVLAAYFTRKYGAMDQSGRCDRGTRAPS